MIKSSVLVHETMNFPGGCENKKKQFLSCFNLADEYPDTNVIRMIDNHPEATTEQKNQFKKNLGLIPVDPWETVPVNTYIVNVYLENGSTGFTNTRNIANLIADSPSSIYNAMKVEVERTTNRDSLHDQRATAFNNRGREKK